MMLHDAMNDDALSLSMFWAGALMVFTPMIGASIVLTVWWWRKRKLASQPTSVESQASGVATRPT
jgi:hypothetical protein